MENNIILITGGSSGIGFELAKRLLSKGNTVLICGRSEEKLQRAKKEMPGVHIFRCNLSKQTERVKLFEWVASNHPDCNLLINNAAVVHRADFYDDDSIVEKAELEIATNLMAPIALSKLFMPLLLENKGAAIVNITTGLVYAPRAVYPVYNATKAALHSFSQVLRYQLKHRHIDVIEVLMPAVDTPWHQENPPKIAISPEKAVEEMLRKMEKGQKEIKIGGVKILYALSRIAPSFAFRKINSL